MGANFAGVVRLKPNSERGRKITLRFAERLNPDGTIYTANLREARATDTYICRGDLRETWEPRFTFHGFQYVEVTGLKSPPNRETIAGISISSDTPDVGELPLRRSDAQPAFRRISTGRSGPTSSTSRPTAPSATSGWAGPAMRRSTSRRRP